MILVQVAPLVSLLRPTETWTEGFFHGPFEAIYNDHSTGVYRVGQRGWTEQGVGDKPSRKLRTSKKRSSFFTTSSCDGHKKIWIHSSCRSDR